MREAAGDQSDHRFAILGLAIVPAMREIVARKFRLQFSAVPGH
jgi:hypothetical protein